MTPDVDRGGLLCALTLAPTTYARNRFYALFTESSARRTRSRAAHLRTIVRHFTHDNPRAELAELAELEDGTFRLRYVLRRLKLKRSSVLDRLELSLVRFTIARRMKPGSEPMPAALVVSSDDRALVFGAIAKLGEKLVLPLDLSEKGTPNASEEYHPAPTPGDS
jgi:hypothetical protein